MDFSRFQRFNIHIIKLRTTMISMRIQLCMVILQPWGFLLNCWSWTTQCRTIADWMWIIGIACCMIELLKLYIHPLSLLAFVDCIHVFVWLCTDDHWLDSSVLLYFSFGTTQKMLHGAICDDRNPDILMLSCVCVCCLFVGPAQMIAQLVIYRLWLWLVPDCNWPPQQWICNTNDDWTYWKRQFLGCMY